MTHLFILLKNQRDPAALWTMQFNSASVSLTLHSLCSFLSLTSVHSHTHNFSTHTHGQSESGQVVICLQSGSSYNLFHFILFCVLNVRDFLHPFLFRRFMELNIILNQIIYCELERLVGQTSSFNYDLRFSPPVSPSGPQPLSLSSTIFK